MSDADIAMGEADEVISLGIENRNLRSLLQTALRSVAEQKDAERLQQLVLEEMHHRVKNTLAIVQAIVVQSLRSAETLDYANGAITSRILALGRVHDLLLRTDWDGARLKDLLITATKPFDSRDASRFAIESPDVEVNSGSALSLVMALNELCTNAVKYGALSNADGRVAITARVDGVAELLRIEWAESGGPPVRAATRRSFGMKLIEQLVGTAQVRFETSGLICLLDIPLAVIQPRTSD
jgi:two-component sensor histidine kinase